MINEDRSEWKKCALCGKIVHPWQETSAEPLAKGIACVSCAFNQVDATRKNHGIPSHKVTEHNKQTGKWETNIVPLNLSLKRRGKKSDV